MPHQISSATGCELNEAMQILLLLYHRNLAYILLLVYHLSNPDTPMFSKRIFEGLPEPPILNPFTEENIDNLDELSYDFLFVLTQKQDIEFVSEIHESI
jgi:hypothetical protein